MCKKVHLLTSELDDSDNIEIGTGSQIVISFQSRARASGLIKPPPFFESFLKTLREE